jgi:hypothetical protein
MLIMPLEGHASRGGKQGRKNFLQKQFDRARDKMQLRVRCTKITLLTKAKV